MRQGIRKHILLRVRLAFLAVLLLGGLVIFRVLELQYAQGEKWERVARENGLRYMKVQALRGNILSDNGDLLATSLPFFQVAIDPTIPSEELINENIDTLSVLLAGYFTDKTAEEYKTEILEAREQGRQYKRLSRKLVQYHHKKDMEQWPLFREGRMAGGAIFTKVDKRFMPFAPLGRRMIGFVREDSAEVNGVGLEYSFQQMLGGINGEALYQRMPGGDWKPVNDDSQVRPENGFDVQTTIDVEIQEHASNVLKRSLRYHRANYGCVLVMHVKTGEIKAMVNFSRTDRGDYVEDYNYAIGPQGTTEPGSTFKLASFMALLEETEISIEDTVNTHDGEFEFYEDCIMRDPVYYGYGKIPVRSVFEKSSNIGTSRLVFLHFMEKPQKYLEYMRRFGLDRPLGFQMLGEGKPFFNRPGSEGWSGCSLPWLSIGYELKLSPLQMLTFYNAVANNGKMVQPMVVRKVVKGNKIIREYGTEVINEKICSDRTLKIARGLLEGVVDRGTARIIKNDEYRIAGKTGTAHKVVNGKYVDSYYSSFAGYFPAEDPEYSIIVAIDDPRAGEHYGGEVAAPVFRSIADRLYLNLERTLPDTLQADSEVFPMIQAGYYKDLEMLSDEFDLKTVPMHTTPWVRTKTSGDTIQWHNNQMPEGTVPDVRGMTLRDALYVLENQGLKVKVRGEGRVQRQSLRPGIRISRGRVVYISLG